MANMTQETINKVKELNQQYKAGEITEDQVRAGVADEYYKRQPEKLQNADVNLTQYGDDSSPENYNNPDLWGGMNDKYTGENTKNSQVAYDPNATVEGLDPNYQYGRNAQMANSDSANYIATRNDQIASALYNAGKTSIGDVRNFLEGQRGFFNSNENERENTINSVWKRLGQIASENGNNNEQGQSNTNNDQALENMQNDLMKDTTGQLYGKVTADEGNPENGITTQADPYNVDRMMAEARIANVKKLQTMDSQSIAASIISGTTPYGEQAMRDLMQYNPQKYEEVQTAVKQLKGQKTINSITSGEGEVSTVTNTTASDMATFAENNSNDMTSAGQILKDVRSTLESNTSASTAQEQMATIEGDMARLQNRLKNLDKEASKVFKGDVPQYIVNAYISNRTAEINDELSILENRYNAAYNRYKTELANTQWEKEYALKVEQLKIQQEQSAVNNWATQQGIMINWAKTKTTTTLTQDQITQTFNSFLETYTDGMDLGPTAGQCGAFVKSYLSQLGISLPNISALSAKKALINPDITDPTEGDVVIMSSSTHPENGHMAIVSSIDDDGTIHLLEANWNDDHKVHTTRTVKPGDSRILGYYRPQAASYNPVDSFVRKDGTTIETKDTRFNQLTADEQKVVEGLINKQINPSTLTTRYGEERGSLLKSIASEIDPNYTDGAYSTAVKTRNDWSTSSSKGSNSRNGTAVATAMELYNMADTIGNTKFKDWNALVNFFKGKVSDEKYVEMIANLNTLAFEYAGALKGGASPTEQDVNDAKDYITANLGKKATKTTAKTLARMLYNKNVNEAQNYFTYTYEKAPSIWDNNVEQRMINTVGLPLGDNYALKSMANTLPDYDGGNGEGNTYQSYLN